MPDSSRRARRTPCRTEAWRADRSRRSKGLELITPKTAESTGDRQHALTPDVVPDRPTAGWTVIEPPRGFQFFPFREVWAYRELLFFLVWRDVKLRYKQTALGVVWVALQPLALAAMFTVVFSRFLSAPSAGLPYPVFVLAALVPWQLFAAALARASLSLVANEHLLTKIYFPRILIPLASVLTASIDMLFTLLVLCTMLAVYGVGVSVAILVLPALILLALCAALGVGLLLAALNVRYRDIQAIIPFLTQIWLFATPIAYAPSLVPAGWRWLYELNPMVGLVEGMRWTLVGGPAPRALITSAIVITVLLGAGIAYFRRAERHFADIV
ncbi:MAG: ABC transporter permease [Actinomycetota bacterium]|nr:ABC transporter permease [Actinomycetota bacterium]